jgi:hypothetical protein
MIIMTPLLTPRICSPSPPALSWRRAAAPETFAQARSYLTAFRQIHTQLIRSASSQRAEASDPGANARNRCRRTQVATFKFP